jgi:hypothetical protein
MCSDVTDDQFIGRLTALDMFESHLCRGIRKHDEWFGSLKYMLDKGLVFRFPDGRSWKPGMMKKEGKNWVWKEKSFEELREEYDIHLLSVSWFTSSAVFTVWRIYLNRRFISKKYLSKNCESLMTSIY